MSSVEVNRENADVANTNRQANLAEGYEIKELNDSQKQYIRSSIPILESSGVNLTKAFYQKMLGNYPEVLPYFNKAHQISLSQPRILAFALLNYAKNIDDLTSLSAFIDQIVVKHVGLQIKAEHYPIVGHCLLSTMQELLPIDVATPAFLEAWTTAYGNLAKILIDCEKKVYQSQPWNGFVEFKVTELINESSDVKSVYLGPKDPAFRISHAHPGQYVSVLWEIPGLSHKTLREYSLSNRVDTCRNQFRISVRRVAGGVVSNFVHDNLKVGDIVGVSPPAGNFVYKRSEENVNRPLLCFAGGIGITPLIPIIETALLDGRKVNFCYSSRNYVSRPFKQWLEQLKLKYKENLKLKEFFSEESSVTKEQIVDEVMTRIINEEDLEKLDLSECDIYMLGPNNYMRFVKQELVKLGVEPNKVQSEFFGPYIP